MSIIRAIIVIGLISNSVVAAAEPPFVAPTVRLADETPRIIPVYQPVDPDDITPLEPAPGTADIPDDTTPPQSSNFRLASVPKMFGDFLGSGGLSIPVLSPGVLQTRTLTFNSVSPNLQPPFDPAAPVRFGPVPAPTVFGLAIPANVVFQTQAPFNAILLPTVGATTPLDAGDPNYLTAVDQAVAAAFGFVPGIIDVQNANAELTNDSDGVNQQILAADEFQITQVVNFTPLIRGANVLIPPPGGAMRRTKISENNSPYPDHRIFFSHNFFNDVQGGIGDVNRYSFGVETLIGSGHSSLELRVPFASTLDSNQTAGGISARNTEIGDLSINFKTILMMADNHLIAGGLGISTPTANDSRVTLVDGTPILELRNQSVHVLPYLALLGASERSFLQAWIQLDIDANGNPVWGDITGANVSQIGVFHDPMIMFLDLLIGHWMYQGTGHITGLAPFAELHYATSLENTDRVAGNDLVIADLTNRFDILNLTMGMHIALGEYLTITPAMSIPMRDGHDEEFDYEAGVQANFTPY